jgi:LacI family transcriptional regulator
MARPEKSPKLRKTRQQRLKDHPRRVTIADLATLLQVAPSTISRALASSPQVSKATCERVQALAAEHHYLPNHLAAALRKGHSQTLGVLVPHLTGFFFPEVVNGMAEEASRMGYNVIICQSNETQGLEMRQLDLLLNARVEGIIVSVATATRTYKHFEQVRAQGVPLVFFDRVAPGMVGDGVRTVRLDDYAGAYAAVAHLIEQGCERIAHVAGPLHLDINRNRYQGYLDALEAHGLTPDPALLYRSPTLTQVAGAAGIAAFLDLPEPPDALFAATDLVAVGAMQVLRERGLRVPEDVAVVGFSNELFTTLTQPPITSVDQRCQLMGELAVKTLLSMLPGSVEEALPPEVVLAPELLIRSSSQRLLRLATSR